MITARALAAFLFLSTPLPTSSQAPTPPPGWRTLSFAPASGGNSIALSAAALSADAISLAALIALAYDVPESRVVCPAETRDQRYAVKAIAERGERSEFRMLLRQALADRFGIATRPGKDVLDVLVISRAPADQALRASGTTDGLDGRPGGLSGEGTLGAITGFLEREFGVPIVDESGLSGSFVVNLLWQPRDVKSLAAALKDRFGLELTRDRRQLDVLVVDRVPPLD
jgi:uncharacterized protein (TIGR03435 family)